MFRSESYPLKIKQVGQVVVLVALVLACTYLITLLGPQKGVLVAVVIVATGVGVYSVINFKFGFYAAIALGFTIFYFSRILQDAIPVGIVVDLQIMATFMGLIVHKIMRREPFFNNARHIITYAYLIYTLFLLVQLFNPSMGSIDGWILTFRKFVQFVMIYFVGLNVFTNEKEVRFFFLFWIGFSLIAALYGCYQQWFGLFQFEIDWIWAVPGRAGLYFLNDGSFRKFSLLSDPAAFGITMAASALLVLVLTIGWKGTRKKIWLLVSCVFLFLSVSYSGTRTAYFIICAGMVLYILMTITNKKSLLVACFFGMGLAFILWAPIYGNTTINRIRSTFEFSDEESLQVRDINRKNIQPYVYRHPIGGGLATCGVQGLEFNPDHYLAGFPPDSGYIKSFVETGWIGFFFQCLLYFIILRSGVHGFYQTSHKRIKLYYLAVIVSVFSFVIAQYGQEAIGQVPSFFLFYTSLALIVRLKDMNGSDKTAQTQKQIYV